MDLLCLTLWLRTAFKPSHFPPCVGMWVSDGWRCCMIVKENEKLLVCSIIGALRIHLPYSEGFFLRRLGCHLLYMVWWFICVFTCSESYVNVFKSPWYYHGVWTQTHSSRLDRRRGKCASIEKRAFAAKHSTDPAYLEVNKEFIEVRFLQPTDYVFAKSAC